MNQKHSQSTFHFKCICEFDCPECNSNQKWKSDKSQFKNCLWKEDHAWNVNTYNSECYKHRYIDEYLKSCTWIKSIIGILVITSDEIANKKQHKNRLLNWYTFLITILLLKITITA